MSKKWLLVMGLLSAAFIAGFLLGKNTSWDSTKPSTALIFMARHAEWQHLSDKRGTLTLRGGPVIYSYSTGDKEVSLRYLRPDEAAVMPMPTVDMDKDTKELITLIVAPPAETGLLATVLKSTGKESELEALSLRAKVGIAVVTLGTFWAGYALGHRNEPDYDNTTFQSALKDTKLWSQYEHEFSEFYEQAVVLISINCIDSDKEIRDELIKRKNSGFYSLHPEIFKQAIQAPKVSKTILKFKDPSCLSF